MRSACELARVHLKAAECEMNQRYYRQSKVRDLAPGDEVLVLLPLLGNPLQVFCVLFCC